jgi:hypothetical protein
METKNSIEGEKISDGVLILQAVEKVNLSGMFFYGDQWVRVASGCIVDGSLSPMESVSMLFYGFHTIPWKWVRTENTSCGPYFFPLSLLIICKLTANIHFTQQATV